jgi:two-component system cell cycle sensor histidine kinase/response regulator CckA
MARFDPVQRGLGMADASGTAQQGSADTWTSWHRRLVLAGLLLSIALAVTAYVIGQGGASPLLRVPAYLVLPIAITAAVAAGRKGGARYLILAAILINVEALLLSVLLAMGLALAVLLPVISLGLVLESLHGRALVLAFVSGGLTCLAGIMIALLFGPVSQAQQLRDPLLVVATCALFITFGLGYLYLLNARRTQALAALRGELESRRAAEAELQRASQVLAAVVDSSPVPTQVIGADRKVMVWNPASEKVFGWTAAEVVGHELPVEMTPEDDRVPSAERIRRTMAGRTVRGDRVRRLTRDGREVWADMYAGPLHGPDGRPIGIAGQLVDVTDRVAMEGSLIQAAKMEAIGGLAGGIAHDFNNILTAIRGHAELVRASLSNASPEDRADLDEIIQAADRAAGLTRQLLAFARRTELEPRVLDPAEVVRSFAPMLSRLMGEDVRLVLDLTAGTGRIKTDPIQLEQVILNLAVNARDAMPSGGELRIAMADAEIDAAEAAVHPDAKPGPYVEITVADTGTGISKELQGRIFEPFFTTKEPGKGTGMGLATVFGIVKMSDGWIDLRSEPGRGATFRLYFPRVEPSPEAGGEAAAAGAVAGGSETILLVEDDVAVRTFSRRCLADLGYRVIEATGGQHALRVARAHDGPIDLLLSDVVMPGLHGPELAARLAKQRPGIRIVLCSGYAGGEIAAAGGSGAAYLAKPYSVEALARVVRATLDRPA